MNIKKILHFSIGPIGAALLGILTIPALAWIFTVEDIGRFSILQIVMSFSCILLTLGLDQAYVREYHEVENKAVIFKTSILTSVLFSIFIALLFLLFGINSISQNAYKLSSFYLSYMTIVCVILTVLLRYVTLNIRMQEKGLIYSISQIFPKIFLLVAVLSLFFLGGDDIDFNQLITIQASSLFLVLFIFCLYIKDELICLLKVKFDYEILKKMLVFGFPLVVSGLVFWLMQACSRIFLLNNSTLAEVGLFSVAVSISAGFSVLTTIFNTIWVPTIYKLIKEGDPVKEVENVSQIIALVISFILFAVCIVMPLIPKFLPNTYMGIEYIILLCILQPLLYTLSESTAIGILVKRKTILSIFVSIIGLLANMLLLWFLVKNNGAIGAAISIAISFWIYFIIRTEISSRVWRDFKRSKLYLHSLLCVFFSLLVSLMGWGYIYIVFTALFFLIFSIFMFLDVFRNILRNISSYMRML
ncbi:lipopolysaccharide biosynthesis protein [Acinetobacter courvalinii]|uniref:lipopolysaccharide biosynthesis protein n=1 Tax=Acinetobacter courvalinii TaxID=280147 RepID=UPI0021D0C6F2|nr:lipopolysaccharide biosynthesis protein [Acinetobacter courvalinii]MCU4640926.1 lipopolysaccharide biosynthesis protein [Acinetobacter courvalinii]